MGITFSGNIKLSGAMKAQVTPSGSTGLIASYTQQMSYGFSTVLNFDIPAGAIAVVACGSEAGFHNSVLSDITGMSGHGLTWTQRSKYADPSVDTGQQAEIWYAVNNTGSTINDDLTITYSTNIDDQATIVAIFGGVNLSSPWTSSGPSYSNQFNGSNQATVTMNIAESNTLGIAFFSIPNYGTNDSSSGTQPGFAIGWTDVNAADNGGANWWEYMNMSYKQFSSPQTNLTVTASGLQDPVSDPAGLTVIADAVVLI